MFSSNHSWLVCSTFALGILGSACGSSSGSGTGGAVAGGTASGGSGVNSAAGSAGAAPASAGMGGMLGGSGAAGAGATGGALGGATAGGGAGAGGASAGADSGGSAGSGATLPSGTPATVVLDGATLKKVQQSLLGGGAADQKAAFTNLIAAAEVALKSGTWSVTTKAAEYVINKDPHEYVSWGPYYWPPDANPPGTPGTFGKCPYTSHDGIHNPDVEKVTDRHGLHASSEAIFELALAWYLSGSNQYADQAELVARTWYLNAATAMNPSMAYAQSAGPCGTGNPTGIIEASSVVMTDALDGLAILALDTRANGWTAADQAGMKAWLTKYIDFLKTSTVGKGESSSTNNHGSWYDGLLTSLYVFTGDTADATALATTAKAKRIDVQINADGSQPLELARPASWHYSNYNASALCRLAAVAKHVGVDLWGYTNPKGGSIAKAIAFLLPTSTSATLPGPWAQYNDITQPFDAGYQAESYYSIHALADYGGSAAAAAV
ncbi:MAG TPA: alginate lyase family protein, partial [Polyangiaceae bacterium]